MTKRNKIIVISIIAAVLLALVIWLLWLYFNREPAQPPADPSAIDVPVVLPQASAGNPDNDLTPSEQVSRTSVKSVAMQFAGRYGSYSNQGNFTNLEDLESLMTEKLKIETDSYIASQKNTAQQDQPYYGITSIALSATVESIDESSGRATVVVNTQRQESRGTTVNPRVNYQKLNLELVETQSGWKVDSASWQ